MSISGFVDEKDRQIQGAKEERKRISKRPGSVESKNAELSALNDRIDRTGIVNPDPNYCYRLVDRRKEGERVSLLEGMGYEVVPEDKAGTDTRLNMRSKKDGGQTQGDLILMRVPVEQYEAGRARKRRKLDSMYEDKKATTQESIQRIGSDAGVRIETFDESGNF